MPQMHIQVVSGAPGVTFTEPNKFSFTMTNQYSARDGDRVSLKSLRMYYSWFNISAKKNNNQFSYIWVDGSTHQVTIEDGIWNYSDFQAYVNLVMRQKGHYLMNGSIPVYFIRFDVNGVFYRISLTCTPVPAVLPEGWTAPAGWIAPSSDKTPQVVLPTAAIRSYLGFAAGTYPAATQSTLYQVNGSLVPQVTDISSLQLHTNLTDNEYGPDARTLAAFHVEPGTASGSLISEVPFYQDWIPVQANKRYTEITLELVNQNGNPVKIEDPTGFICTLTIDAAGNN